MPRNTGENLSGLQGFKMALVTVRIYPLLQRFLMRI